jgi:hypothetical protein
MTDLATSPSRRALVLGAGAAIAAAASPALARASAYARISVDVSPLRRRGLGPYADLVQRDLQAALARAFAGRVGAGAGAALVVRITAVQLSAFANPPTGRVDRFGGGGMSENDYMEGEALVMSGGRLTLRHPQLAVLPASSGGAWYVDGFELRRTAALCDAYAQWLARSL